MTPKSIAAFLASPGMCWGDDERNAQPHRFQDIRKPLPTPLLFPVSIGAAEPSFEYRRACKARMIAWVSDRLREKPYADEHAAWIIATDLAVAEIGRPLHGNEGTLITSAVRDVVNAQTAAALRTPGRMFAR